MKAVRWVVPALLWAAPAFAQDVEWVEVRFYRVHLKNGNFIDGQLAQQSERQVQLKMKVGEMAIRRDLIDRVEFMKIRSLHEKPKPVEPKKPAAAKPTVLPTVSATPGEAVPKDKVREVAERLRNVPPERKYDLVSELMKTEGATAGYLAKLLGSSDPEMRPHLSEVLTIMKDREAVPALVEHLSSEDAGLRAAAAELIGQLGNERTASDLRPLLRDPDSGVRVAAIVALQTLGDRRSFDDVANLTRDKESAVRNRAINGLFEIARKHDMMKDAVEALTRSLDRARGDAPVDLLRGIGRSGQKDAWRTLASYLNDREARIRSAAAEALAQLNAAESKQSILDRLPLEDDKKTRLNLGIAASRMKILDAIPIFIYWLAEDDADTQASALHNLRVLTGQNFGTDLSKWNAWWSQAKSR